MIFFVNPHDYVMQDAHANRTLSSSHGLIDNRGGGGVSQEDDFALDLLSVAKGQP